MARNPSPGSWSRRFIILRTAIIPATAPQSDDAAIISRTSVSVRSLANCLPRNSPRSGNGSAGSTISLIVEQGAHHGQFARDVLDSTQRRFPEFFSALRYQIVEPFSVLQDRQSETLRQFRDRVLWKKSLDELEPFIGIHFSNELLDAMPINLRGKLVGLDGDTIGVCGRTDRRAAQSSNA